MDYHAVHGHDVEGFGTPSSHRIVTVSAADADALLSPSASSTASGPAAAAAKGVAAASRHVSTGLGTLDAILAGAPGEGQADQGDEDVDPDMPANPADPADSDTDSVQDIDADVAAAAAAAAAAATPQSTAARRPPRCGLRRGQLTEIWGPPGAGKTTFGMQLVAEALRDGQSAVWVDCFHPLSRDRLRAIVEAPAEDRGHADKKDGKDGKDGKDEKEEENNRTETRNLQEAFIHYACPSLPHFLSVFCPPSSSTPPAFFADTAVLVIDSLSALVNYALPKTADRKPAPLMANGKRAPAAHEKRSQVLQYIVAGLERLAETRNLAVVLLTQCASRVQHLTAEATAALVPAISSVVWDRGIATRLVLFRDWAWKDGKPVGGRFAGVQKLNGVGSSGSSDTALSHVVAFSIQETGLVEEQYSAVPPRSSGLAALKRKRGQEGSYSDEEENYGWGEDDSMPNMPPQWQGSEDLLLGHRYEEEEEEEDQEEEEEEEETEEARAEREGGTGRAEYSELSHDRQRRSSQSVADSEEDSDG